MDETTCEIWRSGTDRRPFTYDRCYWSVSRDDPIYASQETIFSEIGQEVLRNAFEGYNTCLMAYGQTGAGKTFSMMGDEADPGLVPRICRAIFERIAQGGGSEGANGTGGARFRDDVTHYGDANDPHRVPTTFRVEVSYLEIYNERVRDLLSDDMTKNYRVRE